MNEELIVDMRQATKPLMAKVAPGRYVRTSLVVPEYTICFWKQVQDGSYEPIPETTRLLRVTSKLLYALGMGRQEKTMRRLASAGFIEMLPSAPHTWMLNLDSWFNHLRRVAEDEEFWEPGKGNLEQYLEVLRGAGRLV